MTPMDLLPVDLWALILNRRTSYSWRIPTTTRFMRRRELIKLKRISKTFYTLITILELRWYVYQYQPTPGTLSYFGTWADHITHVLYREIPQHFICFPTAPRDVEIDHHPWVLDLSPLLLNIHRLILKDTYFHPFGLSQCPALEVLSIYFERLVPQQGLVTDWKFCAPLRQFRTMGTVWIRQWLGEDGLHEYTYCPTVGDSNLEVLPRRGDIWEGHY